MYSTMRKLVYHLCFIVIFALNVGAQTTPPYTGEDLTGTQEGKGNTRIGKVVRVKDWLYTEISFNEWYKKRGQVAPHTTQGLLCNPYRVDGTTLNFNCGIPQGFTGHVPIYSAGNRWPFVGPQQPQPNYKSLDEDAGLYFKNGVVIQTNEPLFVAGSPSGPFAVNKTPYSIILTVGLFPGNEQPGQCMTPVNPGDSVAIPVPPQGWWNDAIPELYTSVAGLHPLDIHGWHHSSHSAIYPSGTGHPDFGTPGFAYTLNTKHGTANFLPHYLWGGLNSNEGYDPIVSGDPGYGVAFYLDDVLQGVVDIVPDPQNPYEADATVVALAAHNPHEGDAGFGATQLKCMPVYDSVKRSLYRFIPHGEAQKLIESMKQSGHPSAQKRYRSNANAVVNDIPLPPVIPGDSTTSIAQSSNWRIKSPIQLSLLSNKKILKVTSKQPIAVTLFNAQGKQVYRNKNRHSNQSVDLRYCNAGVLFLHYSSKHSRGTQRVVLCN